MKKRLTIGPSPAGAVRAFLDDALTSGSMRPGDRLPTERSLAEELTVPRSAVRTALASLEREGRITRQVGRGTFLADVDRRSSGDALATSPAEIIDTRLIFEPELSSLSARNAIQVDLDQMQLCLRRGNAADAYEEFERWDAAFHRAVAAGVRNALLLQMFDTMNAARDLPVWGSIKRRSASAASRAAYRSQHTAIYDAIVDRDPDRARTAMREHLCVVRENLLARPG
jgi:DNA-binding FadR family transcriptional regulator